MGIRAAALPSQARLHGLGILPIADNKTMIPRHTRTHMFLPDPSTEGSSAHGTFSHRMGAVGAASTASVLHDATGIGRMQWRGDVRIWHGATRARTHDFRFARVQQLM